MTNVAIRRVGTSQAWQAVLPGKSVNTVSDRDADDEQDTEQQRYTHQDGPGRQPMYHRRIPDGFGRAVAAAALRTLLVLRSRSGRRPRS
ncbi:MAG TPA: hypothetical protein VGX25_04890 [Actinophytocola sp.]|uniref:hypothetical protein n=1 Tax=Actinophytocola sp. TaxID=1872138 RepID=UPI002DDCC2B9|nr:hypothetical protein [Actinophytocola sp.]HEV2778718.1 hypothetical protein [Actinophytocola sp.]